MLFLQVHDKHIETDKVVQMTDKEVLMEPINRFPHFITHSIDRYDGLTRVMSAFFFSTIFLKEKSAFDLLVFCSLQRDSA